MIDKDHAKTLLGRVDLLQAIAVGKPIERKDGKGNWVPTNFPDLSNKDIEYRVGERHFHIDLTEGEVRTLITRLGRGTGVDPAVICDISAKLKDALGE